ncbi:MAG: hypothetical protein GKR89_08065 [Candidatus Latescibacteria bacterium]|nr:hypothetical protein [Candidatus Latescibacterota bacterium]
MWTGIMAGIAVGVVNGLIAWWLVKWGQGRDFIIFVKLFVAGMIGRFVLVVGGSLLLLVSFPSIHRGPYLGALIASFVLVQALEFASVLKGAKKKGKNDAENGETKT